MITLCGTVNSSVSKKEPERISHHSAGFAVEKNQLVLSKTIRAGL